ncbi:COPII subunit [Boothiomyces macroporosus]|uniref:COPII subunit n=1 Tax=Boothiomyces macroporosus TaxID=261099 RepID=A0AAD5Y964_9FUNG|nr:COPII subunit [Boothiomyces macroporosus]
MPSLPYQGFRPQVTPDQNTLANVPVNSGLQNQNFAAKPPTQPQPRPFIPQPSLPNQPAPNYPQANTNYGQIPQPFTGINQNQPTREANQVNGASANFGAQPAPAFKVPQPSFGVPQPNYPANQPSQPVQPVQYGVPQPNAYPNAPQPGGYNGMQPGQPQPGMQPGIQGIQPGMQPGVQPQMGFAPPVNGFQNMSIGGTQPTGINLMAGPPAIDSFAAPPPPLNIKQPSVTQSATANSDPLYKRCTLNAFPNSSQLLGKSKLPLGIMLTPFRQLLPGDPEVPVIQSPQIVRCRRCRSYINPWVQFVEQGTRWKCNMCSLSNDVPSFFDWDQDNRNRVDRMARPELNLGVVEYIAPQEYMIRPPQPVVFLFVIDVSQGAVQSGMVATAANAILETIDKIPNTDDRTKIGFITFDTSIHFYNLNSHLSEPQVLIVPDLEQPFLPLPYDLLVPLSESRNVVKALLRKLPSLYGTTFQSLSATGKALRSAEKLIGAIGGKIILLQHALPTHDEGWLKVREDPKLLGTPKEVALLQPAITFYKTFAVDCSGAQISLDIFLFNEKYADVATLSNNCLILGGLAKFTGGGVYYYQGFNASKGEDAMKFSYELSHLLTRPLGLEAVIRIRSTKAIKMSAFHGNFFLRSADLLALPNVNPDNAYTVELQILEDIKTPSICFQTAVLYTSSSGERRIRVLTLNVPVTTSLSEVYIGADQAAIAALLVKKAVDRSLTSKIEDARDALTYKLTEILTFYKQQFNQATHPQQLMIAENLRLLPIYILGMLKNLCFRDSSVIPSDLRSYMLALHYAACPEFQLDNLYPRFWNLSSLLADPAIGKKDENGKLVYPQRLNLSSEKLDRTGIFLLENGLQTFIWIGRNADLSLLANVFGQQSLDQVVCGKTTLPRLENDINARVYALIDDIRLTRLLQATIHSQLYVVREDGDPSLRMWFLSHLIEDRIEKLLSYPQFLATIRENVQKAKS